MAGIIEAIATATEIFDKSKNGLSGKDILKVMKSTELAKIKADGSMLKLMGNYIVEPVCVITKDLKENEIIDKLAGLHSDMFTGFYMQTMDILRHVYGMNDADAIDIMATDNGGVGRAVLSGVEVALEDRDTDFLGELLKDDFVLTVEALEDDRFQLEEDKFEHQKKKDISAAKDNEIKAKLEKDKFEHQKKKDISAARSNERKESADARRDRNSQLQNKEATKLSEAHKDLLIPNALQRTIEISITRTTTDGGKFTVLIPVIIKTQIIYTDSENIINAMSPNSSDKSFISRLDDYKSSAVSFMDFMFAGDLVKKYKHNKLKDKDDLLKLLQSRKISSNSKYSDQGMAGFEKYYTMYIISKETAVKVENFMRGKFKSYKHKESFLEQALGLSVTIVDEDYERVQMYLKDLKGSTDLTFKGIVKKDKNETNMDEMVKALMANRPPVF